MSTTVVTQGSEGQSIAATMVAIATVGLAFKGIFAKLVYAEGMDVEQVIALRLLFAIPVFALGAMLLLRRTPEPVWGWSEYRAAGIGGVLFFLATWSDFTALSLIDAGLSRMVLFTFPAFILLINALRNRTMPTPRALMCFVITYLGLALTVGPTIGEQSTIAWLGIAAGLSSALSYAVFLIYCQDYTRKLGSVRFTAVTNGVVGVISLGYGLWLLGPAVVVPPNSTAAGWLFLMAVFATAVPFFLMQEGVRRWGADNAALLNLFGPVITMVAAFFFLGERLSATQGVGIMIVLGGMAVLQGSDCIIRRRLWGPASD
jgi:drug/metabolite transporter (DMT)-like permease